MPTQIQVTYRLFHNDLAELQKHVPEVIWSKTSYKPQVDLSSLASCNLNRIEC